MTAYDLEAPHWAPWQLEPDQQGRPARALYRADGTPASAADPTGWSDYPTARAALNGHGGVAFCQADGFTAYTVDAATDALQEASDLDLATFRVTFFHDHRGLALHAAEATLPALAALIGETSAAYKSPCRG